MNVRDRLTDSILLLFLSQSFSRDVLIGSNRHRSVNVIDGILFSLRRTCNLVTFWTHL